MWRLLLDKLKSLILLRDYPDEMLSLYVRDTLKSLFHPFFHEFAVFKKVDGNKVVRIVGDGSYEESSDYSTSHMKHCLETGQSQTIMDESDLINPKLDLISQSKEWLILIEPIK